MSRTGTFSAIGFSGLALAVTLDTAVGLGGSAFLADICRTFLEGGADTGQMADMDMKPKPLPLILLGLGASVGMAGHLAWNDRQVLTGKAPPEAAEQAAILSAVVAVAAAGGASGRGAIMNIHRIVTGYSLGDELTELALARVDELRDNGLEGIRFAPIANALTRRRVLAAAFVAGCAGRDAAPTVTNLIERMAVDIDADISDVVAARAAIDEWSADIRWNAGLSPLAVLPHRALTLSAA